MLCLAGTINTIGTEGIINTIGTEGITCLTCHRMPVS